MLNKINNFFTDGVHLLYLFSAFFRIRKMTEKNLFYINIQLKTKNRNLIKKYLLTRKKKIF